MPRRSRSSRPTIPCPPSAAASVPQEDQCEETCVTGNKGDPVAIGRLERYVADLERQSGEVKMPKCKEPSGFKVGVIGSGPAGLACAASLAIEGHQVTIFEALHKPGGVLIYGIPEFRLPKAIVRDEIRSLTKMGVEFKCNFVVGSTATIEELMGEWGYDALFIGTGAGLPYFMGVAGENLIGVCSANEFLTRVNLMRGFDFPKYDTPVAIGRRVAVVGAGNVAMDCCRTALRLGCEKVICLYRRTRDEAPARIEELEHAEEEGVDFRWLAAPVEVLGNDDGVVTGVRIQKMELGEPDLSGRPRPVPIEGSEYEVELDSIIVGIGQGANPLLTQATERPRRRQARPHHDRGSDPDDLDPGRLRRWRHRYRRGHRHPRDGGRKAGRPQHRLLPARRSDGARGRTGRREYRDRGGHGGRAQTETPGPGALGRFFLSSRVRPFDGRSAEGSAESQRPVIPRTRDSSGEVEGSPEITGFVRDSKLSGRSDGKSFDIQHPLERVGCRMP